MMMGLERTIVGFDLDLCEDWHALGSNSDNIFCQFANRNEKGQLIFSRENF